MSFKQIIINIDSKSADILSELFFDLDVLSVSIEDQFEGTDLEQAIFDEPGMAAAGLWNHSKLVVLVNDDTNIQELVSNAENLFGQKLQHQVEIIDDQDWVRLTQSQFQPIKVTDNYYIVPTWHELPDKSAKSIILDPGLAFGTGSHPTTFMCLEWIAKNVNSKHNVLDYGCGSGILAITAKKFGAKNVYGVDIDPQAILSSKENATKNQEEIYFTIPEKLPNLEFEVVIANILSNPLRLLAPHLAKLTKAKLILSGILDTQSKELSEIYSNWFTVIEAKLMDGWVLLECTKK